MTFQYTFQWLVVRYCNFLVVALFSSKWKEYWGGVCCFTANAIAVVVRAHDMIFNTRVHIYNNGVLSVNRQ